MSNLVFIENERVLTDSIIVSETFQKRHDSVLRDIRNLDCSKHFRDHNFVESYYNNAQGRPTPKYLITQDGFSFLVMGYTGKKAAQFKEQYINEFNRMKDTLNKKPKSQAELMLMYAENFVQMENRVNQMEQTVDTIQETFLQKDEDWRKQVNTMLNRAAFKLGGEYRNLRNTSYDRLEERGRCDLQRRLRNLKQRLEESGATKTKVNNTTKMDVIDSDPRLKEIYTTIVKEMSIGALRSG